MEDSKAPRISDHLANERTFLAWIRTNIGIMAFGFAVVKFSLFVKQLALVLNRPGLEAGSKGYSAIAGVVLEVLGALLTVAAFVRYRAVRKEIRTGEFKDSFVLISLVSVSIFLICVLLIFYLSESI